MASHVSLLQPHSLLPSRADRPTPLAQGGNALPFGIEFEMQPLYYAGLAIAIVGGACLFSVGKQTNADGSEAPGVVRSFLLFFYSSFLKPHQSNKASQQDALESFYKKQAGAYDATRKVLLRGREDMLSLVVAQLKAKAQMAIGSEKGKANKRIWVDVSRQKKHNLPCKSPS